MLISKTFIENKVNPVTTSENAESEKSESLSQRKSERKRIRREGKFDIIKSLITNV